MHFRPMLAGAGQVNAGPKNLWGHKIWAQVSSPYDLDSYYQFTVRAKGISALIAELDFEGLF